MKLAQTILAAAVMLFLLTWLWLEGSTTEASSAEMGLDALSDFTMAQSALHRDLLSARVGLLRNYDPLTKETQALREAVTRLQAAMPADPQLADAIANLDTLVQSQERWTEQFKSENALLQNSLAYFTLFSAQVDNARGDAARRTTALATAMLRLTLDTSSSATRDVDANLQEMSMSRLSEQDVGTTRALLAHAKLLRDLLPQTDAILRSLFSLPSQMQLENIRALIVQRQQRAEHKAQKFRYLLFATSVLLAGAIVYLGRILQARSRALRKRAAMDHVLARMSTRLISSRSAEIPAIVEQGLGEVAECWGADRAHFASGANTYIWSRPGDRVPTDSRSSLRVETKGRTANAALGLDFVRSPANSREGETGQLRMACDAIANAVERDYLERERTRLEGHLQQARRMETIGALASGVAHNFNNIIGAILGFAESAQSRSTSNARMAEDIGEIQRAGGRARELIDQLLTFGRRGSTLHVPLHLDALVLESKALLEASLPGKINIVVREPVAPVVVAGAPVQLQQAVLNISNNAAQAMDMAGTIEISIQTTQITHAESLDVGELQPGRYGIVSISDTGRGMEPSVRERIFDPFFTTRHAGNGLGLATAREIVLEHGGGLKVQSTPGAGTRFEIWLPIEEQAPAAADPAAESIQGKGETVLVLDSDSARLLMHEEVLAALGYEPAGFADVEKAIAACAQDPERFDAAVLCEDEPSIISRLHATAPRLPIVLATSSVPDLQARALAGNNIVAIIGQPLALPDLAASLARSLQPAEAPMSRLPRSRNTCA